MVLDRTQSHLPDVDSRRGVAASMAAAAVLGCLGGSSRAGRSACENVQLIYQAPPLSH